MRVNMKYDVFRLFPIPIVKFKFKYHSKYYFENIEKSVNLPEEWEIPLNTSFPNIQDDDNFIHFTIRDRLKSDVQICINEVFSDLNLPINYSLNEFWYNIYHKNQGQETHNHLTYINQKSNYWSGIYYNKNASPTKFNRSDVSYQTHFFPGYRESKIKDCYYYSMSPYVEDGDILLFPPHLQHEVLVNNLQDSNMRLTFSFNLVLDF